MRGCITSWVSRRTDTWQAGIGCGDTHTASQAACVCGEICYRKAFPGARDLGEGQSTRNLRRQAESVHMRVHVSVCVSAWSELY